MECCNKDIIKLLEVIVSPVASATQKSRKQSECEKRKRSKSQGSAKSTPENFVDKFLDAKRSCSLIAHPQFVRKNLFSESESIRWAMHSLMKTLFADCSDAKKCVLVDFLWTMFNASVRFGQRAIQYTDLLGFFTIKSGMPPATLKNYGDLVAKTLNSQLTQLSTHSNSLLYSRLAEQLSFGGFYLESQLCLSCNTQNEELTLSTITGLKGDTKFTTTAQIYKLKAGQEIQRVNMKLTDVKRTRHIKTMTLYYTTRTSIPIIELKNSPHLWLKAKTVQLTQGQSDVSFNLPVSIKVNFLIVEFSSFYDESYSIPETLPCPRCSNNVHTDPGICGNCGENVFQCHKCRMINYDERDPFICTQCGFCRYAKFSLSMLSRNCTIADPVETEDERKRAEIELKKQLVKADATWEKLIVQRRELEDSCYDIEYSGEESKKEAKPKAQPLVIKYNECKTSHNDITSMIRAANACRETLADYERRSNLNAVKSETKISAENESASMSSCYGCAVNGAENNLTLIRALCQIASVRENLIADGAVEKLLSSPPNLGSSNLRKLIRRAICRLVRGSKEASKELGERLKDKIIKLAKQNQTIARLDVLLREDLELLKQSLKYRDCGWEYRIKAAMAIFLEASELCETVSSGTTIVNGVLLPCLAILKKQTSSQEKENSRTSSPYDVNYRKWADGDADHQFETRKANRIEEDNSLDEGMKKPLALPESFWLPRLMFCKWSQEARIQACSVVSNLARSRKTEIIELMVSYFKHVNEAGEFAVEYLGLLRNLLVKEQEIDSGLASLLLRGLGDILISQINDLVQQENEVASMTTISSSTDLRVGKSLDAIVLLLITIIDKSNNPFKMIKPILRGYLSLCRVSILRTKAIDDAQDGLLKLLETLTSGGEDIARDFVKICFRTLSHFSKEDFQTSQFVFERLCNIIRPESTEDESFRVQIDKDPLQEEFLPGRMVNNPYPSSVVGETIRDLKNKICRDTELIAMVDDDTSLELLVSNKIVKLDLAVSDVYKKIWLQNHETNVPMRVIYRMRGLMGEATEEFVETLPEDDQNEEEIFKRASYLAVDNGLDLVLEKMDSIRSLNSRSRPLLGAGLKLLGFCVHLRLCRDALAENSSASMLNIMLQLLNICIEAKEAKFVEDILSIMNRVLAEAASHGQETETGHKQELTKLLNAIDSEFVQSRQNIVMSLMEMIPFLSFGDEQLMEQLINHFDSVLSNLSSFDDSEDEQHKIYLDCFCDILKGLKPDNPGGKHLKDIMYGRNLPRQAIDYLRAKTPSDKNYASDEWKDLLEKPVLPFILRILAGLATGHPECQKLIGEMVIPELHRLEQVAAGGIGKFFLKFSVIILYFKEHLPKKLSKLCETILMCSSAFPKLAGLRAKKRQRSAKLTA
jgi:E3 ubiquitin-protein ligase UBR4